MHHSSGSGSSDWAARLLALGLLAFFFLFLIFPVSHLLKGAFFDEQGFTFSHFTLLFENPLLRGALAQSLLLALLTTVLVSVLAFATAHLMTKFDFCGKTLFAGLLLLPMVLPPFVGAIGLRQLFSKFGSINLVLMQIGWIPENEPIDWLGENSLAGMVILQTINLHPILYLNLAAAMANVDPSLLEAARNMGASGWRVFRTITLPLAMPGYFAGAILVFIGSFTDLGTPLIFGVSQVIPVQLFDSLSELQGNPQAYALVALVLLFSLGLFFLGRRTVGKHRHEMFARSQSPASGQPLRGWAAACVTTGLAMFIIFSLLPHVAVVLQSFAGRWIMTTLPDSWTLGHYGEVLGHPLTASSIRNSLVFSSLSACLDLLLGVAIAWILTRHRVPGAWLLDALAMVPLALPGIVLAFGYVASFDISDKNFPLLNRWLDPRENPSLLLVAGYAVRRLPYIVRIAVAGFQQSSVTLEEASSSLGARPWTTLRRITLPLIGANLIAGTILTFAFAMLEVSDSLILAMNEDFFPITKTIWVLMGRIDPASGAVACALGVLGMALLGSALVAASLLLGKRFGQLFR